VNEQINQLLLRAQELAREEVKNTPELAKYAPSYAIPGTEIHVGLRLSYEKFAELIVAECLAQVAKVDDMLEDEPAQHAAVAWVGSTIAEHFGVDV